MGLALLATVIWLWGITKLRSIGSMASNGLAAGVGGIAAIRLLSVSFSLQQSAAWPCWLPPWPGLVSASCVTTQPARIFMGDGGFHSLGFAPCGYQASLGPAGSTIRSLLVPAPADSVRCRLADYVAVIMGPAE